MNLEGWKIIDFGSAAVTNKNLDDTEGFGYLRNAIDCLWQYL